VALAGAGYRRFTRTMAELVGSMPVSAFAAAYAAGEQLLD
jgi:hypothetical protein